MAQDTRVRKIMKKLTEVQNLTQAALCSGMDRKIARRYRDASGLSSEMAKPHPWRTQPNPFEGVWAEVEVLVSTSPGLQAKTPFEHLMRTYPGRYSPGQLRNPAAPCQSLARLEGTG